MTRLGRFSVFFIFVLLATSAFAQRSLTLFQWQDPVWSTPRVFPTGINDARTVVGYIGDDIEKKAFIYERGKISLIEFKHPPDLGGNQLFDINEWGTAVGYLYGGPPGFEETGFLRRANGHYMALGPSPWGVFKPLRINNYDQILGQCASKWCLRKWNGTFALLNPPTAGTSFADISDGGDLVGTDTSVTPSEAFIYRNGAVLTTFGCTDAGVPAPTRAIAIDRYGNVLVSCAVNGALTYFLRHADGSMEAMQTMALPPISPGGVPYPEVTDMNDDWDVTGNVWGFDTPDGIEFLMVRGFLFTEAF